ncbi:hypothetical protein FLA_4924 [Filimonas lacunae]|nr:hypothetical protein FLA_4924 [Filimonas lacunae]
MFLVALFAIQPKATAFGDTTYAIGWYNNSGLPDDEFRVIFTNTATGNTTIFDGVPNSGTLGSIKAGTYNIYVYNKLDNINVHSFRMPCTPYVSGTNATFANVTVPGNLNCLEMDIDW